MKQVALSLVCLSLFFAGVDSVMTSVQISHREASGWLFLSTWFSWAAWASLIWLPVSLLWVVLGRLRRRSDRGAARDAVFLSFIVLGAPTLAHAGLDAALPASPTTADVLSVWPALSALMCLGLAIALAVWLSRWTYRRGLAPLAGAAGLGLVAGMVDLSGGGAGGGGSSVAPAGAPNLVLMVWGSTRDASLSLLGTGRVTAPLLGARSAGMAVFEEARAASVSTVSSNLSMLTGTYPSERAERAAAEGDEGAGAPTLARLLGDAGYRTGAFVGTAALSGDAEVVDGFEVFDDRVDPEFCSTRLWSMIHDVQSFLAGFSPDFGGNGRPCWFKDLARRGEDVLSPALSWIDNGDPRPWFCMIHLEDAGWPYRPSEPAAVRFIAPYDGGVDGYLFESNSYRTVEDVLGDSLEEEDLRYLVDLYEAEILEVDAKVDPFLRQVEAVGRASGREMGAIITSDHGVAFGEHGAFGHRGLHEVQAHVPFLVKSPDGGLLGRRGGRVSGVDVAPTLLSFAGVERAPSMGGLDLASAEPRGDRVVLVERGADAGADEVTRAVYRGEWKLLLHGPGVLTEPLLFNLDGEAAGEDELSVTYPEVVEELQSEFHDIRASWTGAK